MRKSIWLTCVFSTAVFFGLSLCVRPLVGQAKTGTKSPANSPDQPDPEKIRAHVKFLSSDLLEGRGTGQRGGDIAAEYIATQFALYGLHPAGDDGTFFQNVPMVGVKTLPDSSFKLHFKKARAARDCPGVSIHAVNTASQRLRSWANLAL